MFNLSFNQAEHYCRSAHKEASMIYIDSCLQFGIINNAFTTCSELSAIKINDFNALTNSIQNSRRKTKTAKIGLGAIEFGSSLYVGGLILSDKLEDMNVFFNDYQYFLSQKEKLQRLVMALKGKKLSVFPVEENGKKGIMICNFLEGEKAVAQVKLSYDLQDYYGKIQSIEFIPVDKIKFGGMGDPPSIK